ncbi:zinc-dependent metalloprotease [Catenovulum sp. 2E275]|uniref:zinc-dependent metalloprotease n=1 Tax=Catenovulum sp. 2E275 TaxID=2980497 RepID=UPI0021D18065|nr:zinc-dependent metalloprotease [Catenovulum sp. 2E275]MCU4675963.1 zinc-dependent metalloprotease [Catenovulum sp. 2E275]
MEKKRARVNEQGNVIWHGSIPQAEVNSSLDNDAVIIQDEYGITASIHIDGRLVKIRPISNEIHEIVEYDLDRMPADHPTDAVELLETNTVEMLMLSDQISTTPLVNGNQVSTRLTGNANMNTEIKILVGYTTATKNSYAGNISSLIELAVAETNAGYLNSGIPIDLTLVHSYELNYTESGSFSSDLSKFRNDNDGVMDEVHDKRNEYGADIAMILIDNDSYCGLASGIGSTASTAFAATYWDCATGYYSFGHEIGHLLSARHNTEVDPTNTPYPYGHGYQNGNAGWRTIMSYNCSPSCIRINWWSDPVNTYDGAVMGTVSTNDNARVLEETAPIIASFKTASGSTPSGTKVAEYGDPVLGNSYNGCSFNQTYSAGGGYTLYREYSISCDTGVYDVGVIENIQSSTCSFDPKSNGIYVQGNCNNWRVYIE